MKKSTFYKVILLVFFNAIIASIQANGELFFRVNDLLCNNLVNPESTHEPSLSWKTESNIQGLFQTAWEVQIASSEELLNDGKADIWNSGKKQSDEQFNIIPEFDFKSDATRYYWRVRIWNNNEEKSEWSKTVYFTTGLLNEDSWQAKWITYNEDNVEACPYFKKVYNLNNHDKKPVNAVVYLCGLGANEFYLNGKLVDPTRYLDPATTNYERYALYTTFNVTDQLLNGNNCFGVMLADGWFNQKDAWRGANFSYGKPMLRFQLMVDYSDGSSNVFGSDESWSYKTGPVVKSNMFLGETYDARRELKNWCEPEIIDNSWEKAVIAKDNKPPYLVPQMIEPIRKKRLLTAKKIWKDTSGNWIYDFGINIAGIPSLTIENSPVNTSLKIRIAEEVDSAGNLNFNSLGWIHHSEEPTPVYSYIAKGSNKESWEPRFTYSGFRYAELSGFAGTPDTSTLKLMVVHTDLDKTGTFSCSDNQINTLHDLAINTILSNIHGIPTDCPNREKCGWLGDTHPYAKMANLNFQANNFWTKYLNDIRSGAMREEKKTLFHERYNRIFYHTEKKAGLPYMIAPGKRLCGVASPDWGTALVQLPWWLYVYYGNKEILSEFYEDMQYWTDYVSTLATDTARTNKYGKNTKYIIYQGLGDWCPPQYNQNDSTPVEFTSTAFHYLDVSIMQKSAVILNKKDDARRYAELKSAIFKEFVNEFYDRKNKTYGSQTANAMALDLELVPKGDEIDVSNSIVKSMNDKTEGFISTGIFGIGRIGSMLARHGNVEATYNLFTKKGENSFDWMINEAGATSLWERLPINDKSEKAAKKSSHSHPMHAGYDVCFFEDMAGIRPDDSGYGLKTIRFQPLFTAHLSWAKASVKSPYGVIVSDWKLEGEQLKWNITIPPNSSGVVALPNKKNLIVNGVNLNSKKYQKIEDNKEYSLYKFPSGNYEINY